MSGPSPAAIRVATTEDVAAVLALWRAAATAPSATDDADALRGLLDRDPGALIVAERDGELVGSLIVGWDGWRGSFYRLTVLPEHRRAGVARLLIETGVAHLRHRGARRLDAVVSSDQEPALRAWQAAGFTAQPDQVRFVRNLAGEPGPSRQAGGEGPD